MTMTLKYSGISIDPSSDAVRDFPATLVIALYDEAIASLVAAIAAIEAGEIEARFIATTQAIDVVSELRAALDLGQGGDIAANLNKLYEFFVSQVPMINIIDDAASAQELIHLLEPLRRSWVELDDRIRSDVEEAEEMERAYLAAATARKLSRPVLVR